MSTSYLYRNQPSPPQGYYSAWFYVPSTITVGSWLSLTHFSGSATGDGKNLSAIWDVNLYPLPGGGLAAQLYGYASKVNTAQTIPVLFPLDTWVQLEVYLSKATGPTGEVTVWQDGVQILQHAGVATAANDWVQWDAGGAAPSVFPSPSYIYMDDAAISWSPQRGSLTHQSKRRQRRTAGRRYGVVRRMPPRSEGFLPSYPCTL